MKKLFIGSGIVLVLLVIMAFTGLTEHEDRKKAAFNEGNLQYAAGNYEQAIKLYNEAPEKLDRYLNSGNASFKLGEAAKDAEQKLPFYQEAVKTYKLGILKFPENVALKYNYEYVLKKIGPQQDQQDSDKNDDKKDENQDQQPSPSPQPDGQQPSPSGQPDKQEGQQPSPSGQPDNQGDQQPSPSGQPDNQEGQQPSPSGQPDKQEGQQSSQDEQGDKSSPSPSGESSDQSGLSEQELEQVMGMLEKQEEDSLKNNQEIKKEDKGEAYDW